METRKTVLVLDDYAALAGMMERALLALGYRPRVFTSTADCLAWLEGERPDIAFFDVCMPEMDGIHVLVEIRRRGHDFPVVIVTGARTDQVARRAREAGAAAVLDKPLSIRRMMELVEAAGPGAAIRNSEAAEY